jgi:hypothetical protein
MQVESDSNRASTFLLNHAIRYADTPYLSMQTNYICGDPNFNAMYHLRLEGHIFLNTESFTCDAVGYVSRPHNDSIGCC